MVSLTGVTGERAALAARPDASSSAPCATITTKPVCVGFGIGTPGAGGRWSAALADGVIVGSAIVRLVEQHGGSPELLARVGDFIAALKAPLRSGG